MTSTIQKIRALVLPLCASVYFAGCSTGDPSPTSSHVRSDDSSADQGADLVAVDLVAVDYQQLMQFVDEQHGSVVVLDLWNTSCEPCLTALPDLAQLQRKFADQPVVCVTVNNDYTGAVGTTPQDNRDKVLGMLKTLEIDVKNFLSTVPDRQLYKQSLFKENRVYTVPAVLVIDQSGENVTKFGGAAEESPYDEVRKHVQMLLEKA